METIKFTRESFATDEDWETLLEAVRAPMDGSVQSVTIDFDPRGTFYEGE